MHWIAPSEKVIATLEEIRAKDGNLSIPLYVAPAGKGGSEAGSSSPETSKLPDALVVWMKSSGHVRRALSVILEGRQ